MNKQLIQQFLDQSCYDEQDKRELEDWCNVEKFAELIVAECISTLDQDDGATHHGELLREHFGVEEQVNDSKELHTCPYREEIHYDYESLCDCDEQQQHQCLMDI
jgi:hypothetical protein